MRTVLLATIFLMAACTAGSDDLANQSSNSESDNDQANPGETGTATVCEVKERWRACAREAHGVCEERDLGEADCKRYVVEKCGAEPACPAPEPPPCGSEWNNCASTVRHRCAEQQLDDVACKHLLLDTCGEPPSCTPSEPPDCRRVYAGCVEEVHKVCRNEELDEVACKRLTIDKCGEGPRCEPDPDPDPVPPRCIDARVCVERVAKVCAEAEIDDEFCAHLTRRICGEGDGELNPAPDPKAEWRECVAKFKPTCEERHLEETACRRLILDSCGPEPQG